MGGEVGRGVLNSLQMCRHRDNGFICKPIIHRHQVISVWLASVFGRNQQNHRYQSPRSRRQHWLREGCRKKNLTFPNHHYLGQIVTHHHDQHQNSEFSCEVDFLCASTTSTEPTLQYPTSPLAIDGSRGEDVTVVGFQPSPLRLNE